jgi:FdhE protein
MSETGSAKSPVPIGEIASPPFVRLPDPKTLFRRRAQRFALLSPGHSLEPYLRFLAGLSEAQHQAQDGLPAPVLPPSRSPDPAARLGMPPLDLNSFVVDPVVHATFDRLLALAIGIEMPAEARRALERATAFDARAREDLTRSILNEPGSLSSVAERVYVAAALQLHFARLASRFDAKNLAPVGDGACPTCGSRPVASVVVGWRGAHNTRFCACSLCATLWHVVRIKCALCGSTAGISYQEVEGGAGTVRAETCESCHRYVKIMQQQVDPALDPVADDVATLGLDLLVRDAGYKRGAVNPYLLGY